MKRERDPLSTSTSEYILGKKNYFRYSHIHNSLLQPGEKAVMCTTSARSGEIKCPLNSLIKYPRVFNLWLNYSKYRCTIQESSKLWLML